MSITSRAANPPGILSTTIPWAVTALISRNAWCREASNASPRTSTRTPDLFILPRALRTRKRSPVKSSSASRKARPGPVRGPPGGCPRCGAGGDSPAVSRPFREPRGEEAGQGRVQHLPLAPRNVVRRSDPGGCADPGVEEEEGRLRVPVAGLADAAGVEQGGLPFLQTVFAGRNGDGASVPPADDRRGDVGGAEKHELHPPGPR